MTTVTAEDFLAAVLADPCDDTHRLIWADWLEDQGDERHLRLRQYVAMSRRAAELAIPGDGDTGVCAARDRLDSARSLSGCRIWATLCVRWCPLKDARYVWDLLTDPRSTRAVVTAELHWCGLVSDQVLAAARKDAYAAANANAAAYAANVANANAAAYAYAANAATAVTATYAAYAANAAAYADAAANAAAYADAAAYAAAYADAAAYAAYAAYAAADAAANAYAAYAANAARRWCVLLADSLIRWLGESPCS